MDHNHSGFASGIPKPTRNHSPDKSLAELSASAGNARTAGSMAPPPPLASSKHGLSNPSEPAVKKKPRPAAEPIKKSTPASPGSGQNKYGSAARADAGRNQSFSSSTSVRSNSSTSRNTSNSSFSASVGPGGRPQPFQNMGRCKPAPAQRRATPRPGPVRPATSLERHGAVEDGPRSQSTSTPPNSFPVSSSPGKTRASLASPSTPSKVPVKICCDSVWMSPTKRDVSLSTAMESLVLNSAPGREPTGKQSPSRLPKHPPPVSQAPQPDSLSSYTKRSKRSPQKFEQFLTRDSNTKAWDSQKQNETFMNDILDEWYTKMNQAYSDANGFKESNDVYKVSVMTLEKARAELTETNTWLRSELKTAIYRMEEAERIKEAISKDHRSGMEDLGRQHRLDLETVKEQARHDLERLKEDHREELRDVKRRFETKLETEHSQRIEAVSQLSTQGALDQQRRQMEIVAKDHEIRAAITDAERAVVDLERERASGDDLRQNLSTAASNAAALETSRQALQAKVDYLESDSKSQSEAYANMEQQMRKAIDEAQELQDKLRREETLRRKLHNQVQELKGNIRVFCRVRPTLKTDTADEQAKIAFPDGGEDGREIEVRGAEERSSLGTVTTKKYPFAFDRVFGPGSQNQQVFDEISQLIQSALDGFNVCIFCYGQTGSGKTYTMSSGDGMIPRAVHMIYETAQGLEERGWKYEMQGSFVEVYNESLNDLLGRPEEFDKKKHEIRHDLQTCKTTVTDMTCVDLDSPHKVEQILAKAMSNRSVAATRANQRSSRSHSVFILKISGRNSITGEKSEGTLNLVDLAGSERLSQSKVEGARLKETQNINRSLSCLGDVIGALGQGGKDGGGGGGGTAHIPYRNSKLTYLLQFSLGGNSKTLMFCMVSPLEAHLAETLTSLRFATKVHNTYIGTAKRQAKTTSS